MNDIILKNSKEKLVVRGIKFNKIKFLNGMYRVGLVVSDTARNDHNREGSQRSRFQISEPVVHPSGYPFYNRISDNYQMGVLQLEDPIKILVKKIFVNLFYFNTARNDELMFNVLAIFVKKL